MIHNKESFHWILNFGILLMANSLNSTFYYICRNLSDLPYIIEIKESKFAYIYFHEFVRSDPGQLTILCIYFHPEVGYMILKIIHYTLTVIPYS